MNRPRTCFWAAIAAAVFCLPSAALAKDVEEKFDDGTVHLRYHTDAKDQRDGDFQEFYPGGKLKVHGSYSAGKKSGAWTTTAQDGKTLEIAHYRQDALDGPYQYNFLSGKTQMKAVYSNGDYSGNIQSFDETGKLLFSVNYPLQLSAVIKAFQSAEPEHRQTPNMIDEPVTTAPYKAGRMDLKSQETALKYLQLYRYLSGVTIKNMSIDAGFSDECQHGAVVLHQIGSLTHTPDKPADMDAAFFKLAYNGCHESNIAMGPRTLFDAIDMYMDDSDASNIDHVGHRQWILYPGLQRTAFGYADGFSTLHTVDPKGHPNWNFLTLPYPGMGYYPKSMIHASAAWSLSLNSQKVKVTQADLKITITSVDEHFGVKERFTPEIVGIPMDTTGSFPCIIYRTRINDLGVGKYIVHFDGIRTLSNMPAPLTYVVDVVDIPKPGMKPATEPAQ